MRASASQVLIGVLVVAHFLSWQSEIFYPFSGIYWSVMGYSLLGFFVGYWLIASIFLKFGGGLLLLAFTRCGLTDKASHKTFLAMFWLFFQLGLLDRYLMIGPTFFLPETVMQYRITMTMESGQNVIKGLSLGNFFLFMMPAYIIAYPNRFNRISLPLVILAVLFYIYLSSARSTLFISALSAFYFWVLPKKINVNIVIRIVLLVAILIYGFELLGQVVGKSTSELGFIVYAAAPLHAFDALLVGEGTLDDHFLSFYPIHSILMHFFSFLPATSLPNIFTPLPTNVYTMFGVYYADYGMSGLFLAMILIGVISGALQKLYISTGNGLLRLWAAINMTILTLSIFYDYYTTSGVIWMTILLSPFFFSMRPDVKHEKLLSRSRILSVIE